MPRGQRLQACVALRQRRFALERMRMSVSLPNVKLLVSCNPPARRAEREQSPAAVRR